MPEPVADIVKRIMKSESCSRTIADLAGVFLVGDCRRHAEGWDDERDECELVARIVYETLRGTDAGA